MLLRWLKSTKNRTILNREPRRYEPFLRFDRTVIGETTLMFITREHAIPVQSRAKRTIVFEIVRRNCRNRETRFCLILFSFILFHITSL